MPQVGDKHFPYTKAGYKAAATAKKKMGHTDYRKGGLFSKSSGETPSTKQEVRKTKYKKQAKRLLKSMET